MFLLKSLMQEKGCQNSHNLANKNSTHATSVQGELLHGIHLEKFYQIFLQHSWNISANLSMLSKIPIIFAGMLNDPNYHHNFELIELTSWPMKYAKILKKSLHFSNSIVYAKFLNPKITFIGLIIKFQYQCLSWTNNNYLCKVLTLDWHI